MMKKRDGRKLSSKAFRKRTIPVAVFLSVILIIANIVVNLYSAAITSYMGVGDATVTSKYDTAGWNMAYYDQKYQTSAESLAAAAEVAESISDEGITLVKNSNNTLPLKKGAAVTPFGYRYTNPVYGGTGSGNVDVSADYVWTPAEALSEYFLLNETMSNALNSAPFMVMTSNTITEETRVDGINGYNGASTSLVEFSKKIYTSELLSTAHNTTGLVFIGREGGEGADLQYSAYADGTAHQLQLTSYEKETIRIAKENCDKVVVIVNSSNAMELSELMDGELEADAIVLVGGPGAMGFKSMAKILSGEVNPSGKTVDIFVSDLTHDPTYANTGEFNYANRNGLNQTLFMGGFIEYEEGVYYGYRYYETAHDIGAKYFDYDSAVVFPFGYGLSYSTFAKAITGFQDQGDSIAVEVTVRNTGSAHGKDVVEIYSIAPYTDFDIQSKIEKPTAVLAAYAKTRELQPGDSEMLTLYIDKEALASYCYTRDNGDGTTGAYVLEEGEYLISLRSDSHNIIDTRSFMVEKTIWYDSSNPRSSDKVPASNRFSEVSAYMSGDYAEGDGSGAAVILTRADWDNTQPTAPISLDAPAAVIAMLEANEHFDPYTDKLLGNVENSAIYQADLPSSKAKSGLTLSDMRGLSCLDAKWEDFLDQMDYGDSDIISLVGAQGYCTTAYTALGIPYTTDLDGPMGITKQANVNNDSWCAYASGPVLAATWNTSLAYAMGQAVGQEALTTGVTGWYAPGLNIHRSAFSGRNFEYYSEDPLLTGTIGAEVVSGAGDQGLICNLKHFAMNDQETNRVGLLTWATEQTMREISMRGFEICVKTAKKSVTYIADDKGTTKTVVMPATSEVLTAACYIGPTWCSNNYSLVTKVLRGE